MKYKYTGQQPVHIPSRGTFEPGKEYTTAQPINHPDFVEILEVKKKEDKK